MEYDSGLFIGEHKYCLATEFPQRPNGKERRKCNSSDGLAIYEGETTEGSVFYNATCYSCRQAFTKEEVHSSSLADFLGVSPDDGKVKERVNFENKASKKLPITTAERKELWTKTGGAEGNSAKKYRGLSDEVLNFYGFRVEHDNKGQVKAVYFPETVDGKLQGYKSRHHPKKFGIANVGKTGVSSELSGQCRFTEGGKHVIICGGEFDAAAAQMMFRENQVMKKQDAYNRYSVVSPTTGEPSAAKQCRQQYAWLDTHDIITICMDNDEVGREAAADIARVLPKEKVRIMTLSGKDPNQMLLAGKQKQFMSDFYSAKELVNSGIFSSAGLMNSIKGALRRPRLNLPGHMSKLQEMTKGSGLIRNRIYSIIGDTSCGKCHGVGTPIMMFDGTIKSVENVVVGDKLMGADGSIRNVLSTVKGQDTMYRVDQVKGISYTVNSEHILSLRAGYNTSTKDRPLVKGEISNIKVTDYINQNTRNKRSLKGYKGDLTKLGESNTKVFEPYMVGFWLADGACDSTRITFFREDKELLQNFESFIKRNDYKYTVSPSFDRETTVTPLVSGGFRGVLHSNNLIKNKHIPEKYKLACYEDRLQLLSGLLDGDGYLMHGCYEIIQKNKTLANDIVFLARSLGFTVNIRDKFSKCQGFEGAVYQRITISGKVDKLKLKLTRKQCTVKSNLREMQNTAITVTNIGEGAYYGFELDGDHLYCLEDMTVTHNTTHVNSMSYHWFFQPNTRVGIVSLEASNGEYGVDILSLHLSTNLYWVDPDNVEDYLDNPEVIEKANELFVDEYGESRFHILDDREGTVESLEKKCEQLYRQYGCDTIVIDVTTDLLRILTNEQQAAHYNWQSNFVKNGITIINVLHTRKPPASRDVMPKKPTEYDTLGSSIFIQKAAGNMVVYRNKACINDPIEQNTTYWDVPKMRQGATGDKVMASYYDGDTRKTYDRDVFFAENPEKLPVGYDLTVSSFDKAYYEEGGRGWDGVSKGNGGFGKSSPKKDLPVDNFNIDIGNGVVL